MSESEAVNILPKNNSYLLGQEKAEQILLEGWRNNSLHNSWLISGIEGIGKATLAYRFAKFLLAADERAIYQFGDKRKQSGVQTGGQQCPS